MVTIYDVAAQAGVSIKTVSRVLNQEPNVRETTRAHVLAVADRLGYHPNLSARSLAGSRSFVIAVVADATLTLEHWRSEFGTDYLARIQLGVTPPCRAAGYHVLIELIDRDPALMRPQVNALLAALRPDGVILTPPSADDPLMLDLLDHAATPFVRLGPEQPDGPGLRLALDEAAAAAGMVGHLVALGHERIGLIEGAPEYGSSLARRRGFEAALREHRLEPAGIAVGDYTYDSGLRAGAALLGGRFRPTAIFASNDDMALGCMAAANALGLAVPADLSIAGFDDSAGARFASPSLTSVRQPLVELAAAAAEALIWPNGTPDAGRLGTIDRPGFVLVPRNSTAAPPRRHW